MEKNKKNSPNDKKSNKSENKLKDKNILPPKIFSSHSQNRLRNSESNHDMDTKGKKSKPDNPSKSKSSIETAYDSEDDDQNKYKKEQAKPGKSKKKSETKQIHFFEDDILDELKREFPSTTSKSKRRVRIADKTDSEDEPETADGRPKPRARSNAIKEGRNTEAELPDIPSTDIIVEKRDPEPSTNLMGQKGFVSSILFDVISKENNVLPLKESKSKPVSKQSLHERRSTITDVGSDIQAHFERKGKVKPVALMSSVKRAAKSTSSVSSRTYLQKPVESKASVATKSETLPPELQHLKSGWQPADEVDEAPQVGFRQRKQSWVGTYVDGTDYWSKRESSFQLEEVPFEIDRRGQTWYDMPVADEVQIEIPTETTRTLSRAKFDSVKMSPEELEEDVDEEKKRLFSFDDREPIPEKISNDLYQMFLEFCKADDLSAVQNRLSLLNADRSLEKVGLLDHKKLTMIHTGFCFKAAGGSRYHGLTFAQYKLFIEMLAETRKMPVFDFVNRLKLGYAGIIILPNDRR